MNIASVMTPLIGAASWCWWWLKAIFVNVVLTGARLYFGIYLDYVALCDKHWLVENLPWMLLVGFACGALDLVDGEAARRWGVESWIGKILDPLADGTFFLSLGFAVLALENFTPEALRMHGLPGVLMGVYGIVTEIRRLRGKFEKSSVISKITVGLLGAAGICFYGGLVFKLETSGVATLVLHCAFFSAALAWYDYTYYHEKAGHEEAEVVILAHAAQ